MDLAAGAKRLWVLMEHTTKDGTPKLVHTLHLPADGARRGQAHLHQPGDDRRDGARLRGAGHRAGPQPGGSAGAHRGEAASAGVNPRPATAFGSPAAAARPAAPPRSARAPDAPNPAPHPPAAPARMPAHAPADAARSGPAHHAPARRCATMSRSSVRGAFGRARCRPNAASICIRRASNSAGSIACPGSTRKATTALT